MASKKQFSVGRPVMWVGVAVLSAALAAGAWIRIDSLHSLVPCCATMLTSLVPASLPAIAAIEPSCAMATVRAGGCATRINPARSSGAAPRVEREASGFHAMRPAGVQVPATRR